MLIDCINFSRLIFEAANAIENKTRDHLTAAREAFIGYEIFDNTSLRYIDYEEELKRLKEKREGGKENKKKNDLTPEQELKKLIQLSLTKGSINIQNVKFLRQLKNPDDELKNNIDRVFHDYIEMVIKRLNELTVNYKNYFISLFHFVSPIHTKPDKFETLQHISSSEYISESDIKQFMTIILGLAIKNLNRTDEVIEKEAYQLQLGLNLTNKLRIPYLRLAADLGNKIAQYDLAMIYYRGIDGVPADLVQCYEYCIESDSPAGIWTCGWLFQQGQVKKVKKRNAKSEESTEENEKTTKKKRADVVLTTSIEPNYREAIRFYQLGTKKRLLYAKSFNSLGNLSILSLSVPEIPFKLIQIEGKDAIDTAEYYFTKALEMGDCHAAENMGNLYMRKAGNLETGEERSAMYLKAFGFFSIGGEEYGMANCLNRIGEFYAEGFCSAIPRDMQKAETYFRKAIETGGSSYSRWNLAKLLLEKILLISEEEAESLKAEAITLLKEAATFDSNAAAKEMLKNLMS